MGRAASNQKMNEELKSFFSKKPDHYKTGDELDLLNDNCGEYVYILLHSDRLISSNVLLGL